MWDIIGGVPQAAKASTEQGGNAASTFLSCCCPVGTPSVMDWGGDAWEELSPALEEVEEVDEIAVDAEVELDCNPPPGACTWS